MRHKAPRTVASEVVIFAGPHGAGKDTLEQLFTSNYPAAARLVRYSTRLPAPGEVQGETYHFITPQQFAEMAVRGDFLEAASYPEGSSGTSLPDLLAQLHANRYVCLTMNFEDGLIISDKLDDLGILNTCLFIGPCPEVVMIDSPDTYVSILTTRMLQRRRTTDDVAIRLTKARLYRQVFIDHRENVVYIDNSNGRQRVAVRRIMRALRNQHT